MTSVADNALITPQTEAEARLALAAAYRLCAHFRMTDLIYTHLSARVPGEPQHYLILGYGLMFDEVTPDNLVKVDLDGRVVGEAVNPAGINIHHALYRARPDVQAVLHTHTRDGMAVAAQAGGLLPISQFSLQFYGDRLAYHDYEGVSLDPDEQERLAASLGDRKAMILRNHGLLTCGSSVAEAFILLFYLQRSCEVQIAAQAGGGPLHLPSAAVCEHTARQYEEDDQPLGTREWPPLLRLLDRVDPGWRG